MLLTDVPLVTIESHYTTFAPMRWAYRKLLDKKLGKAYWEAAHHLPITEKSDDPFLAKLAIDRKQRRSRAGVYFEQFIEQWLIPLWRSGACDVDVLLDPLFLHFPLARRKPIWYPKVPDGEPEDLLSALAAVDEADPWRLQYRVHPDDHPALEVTRLFRKFFPSAVI